MIEKVSDYRFTSPDVPIMELRVRAAEIADRSGNALDHWEEDGLGPACGMFIRLPCGVVVLLRELGHAVKHLGAAGPAVYIGASEVVEFGIDRLVSEILDCLGLRRDSVGWMAQEEGEGSAKELLTRWKTSLRTEKR